MLGELGVWLVRIADILPAIIGVWEAAKARDAQQELDASLTLVRAIKDRQAREEIENAPSSS